MRRLVLPLVLYGACLLGACTSSGSNDCALTIADECGGDAGFPCPMTISAIPTCGVTTVTCGNYSGFAQAAPGQRRLTFYYDKSSGALVAILDDNFSGSATIACSGSFSAPACTDTATLPPCSGAVDGGVPVDSGSE